MRVVERFLYVLGNAASCGDGVAVVPRPVPDRLRLFATGRRGGGDSSGNLLPPSWVCGDFPGPQPDGDTVKFKPDTPALVDALPRRSGRPAQINSRGISVRLDAIDALETHFDDDHQELAGATAARDALLAQLRFTGVTFFPDAPNNVEAERRGHRPGLGSR